MKCGVRSGNWKGIYHAMLIYSRNWYKRMCLEMMPSWCRQVNWGNCGIPWVKCAFLCVKDDWKGQFWGLRYCLSKLRSLLSFFPSVMTSHSKIAQFNWVYWVLQSTHAIRNSDGRTVQNLITHFRHPSSSLYQRRFALSGSNGDHQR